jgi:two-component system LytT family response regulator
VSIRALIVDDEPLARQRIRTLLLAEPDVEIVGECTDGRQAVIAVEELRPDLMFLDIQMPALDGFGVLDAIAGDDMPIVIFVTAYDSYAIRAFEVHALDYLLKPFDRERFRKAVQRAREQIARQEDAGSNKQLHDLLHDVKTGRKPLDRLVIKTAGRVFFLRADEIDWIEAAGNYLRLHVGNETHLLRETMNSVETRLDTDKFMRIHRSTIVNIERIKELQPWFHGDYVVILRDGTQLPLSRSYRQKMHELLGNSF